MIKGFISYAHKDQRLFEAFLLHLKAMEREGLFEAWNDRKIPPGSEWAGEIDENLEQAQIILLLISADFINSDYCYSLELTRALQRHDAKECKVIPVIIRPCDWHKSPFAKLNPLPPAEKPVTLWSNRDLAWTTIAEAIRRLVTGMAAGAASAASRSGGRLYAFQGEDQLPAIVNVGAPDPDPRFIEPSGIFIRIDEAFGLKDFDGPPRRLVALVGIPGTGKATLAWHYVHSRKASFPHTCWLDLSRFPRGSELSQIEQAFVEIGREVSASVSEDLSNQSLRKAVDEVKQWLSGKPNWLVVCSGMFHPQDVEMVVKSLPEEGARFLLLPLAYAPPSLVRNTVHIPLLTAREGAALLLACSGLAGDGSEIEAIERTCRSDWKYALELAGDRMLGGLPMALQTAGDYLQENAGISLSEYRNMYKNRDPAVMEYFWTKLPGLDKVLLGLHERADQREGYESVSPYVTRLCAVVAPDPVPKRVFDSPALQARIARFSKVTVDHIPEIFTAAQNRAREWGILQASPGKGFFMHAFAQALLTHRMGAEERRQAAANAIIGINDALPETVPPPDSEEFESFLRTSNLLIPHVEDYPRLIGLCELEEKAVDLLLRVARIEQVLNSQEIARALQDGDWSRCFVHPRVSQECREAGPNYATFRSMETPEGRAHMLRLLAILSTLDDRLKLRQSFACMYFLAHYWWDCYFRQQSPESGSLGSPLLDAYSGVQTTDVQGDLQTGQDDVVLLNALMKLQAVYPPVREYRGRENRHAEWNAVGGVLGIVRRNLKIDVENPDFTSSERFLRAITNIYCAEALRYSPETAKEAGLSSDSLYSDNSPLWELYSEAKDHFANIEDSFNENWDLFEESQARLEAAQYYRTRNDNPTTLTRLLEARSLAENTVQRAACIQPRRTIDYLDPELIGNAFRVLADISAESYDPKVCDEAWGCHCAATLAAYAFMQSEGDEYSLQFYGEQVDRLMDRVAGLAGGRFKGTVKVDSVLTFIREFWAPYWSSSSAPKMEELISSLEMPAPERYLLPPRPDLKSIRLADSGMAETAYRQKIREVLQAMADRLSKWKKPTLPLPTMLARVSVKLLEGTSSSNDQ